MLGSKLITDEQVAWEAKQAERIIAMTKATLASADQDLVGFIDSIYQKAYPHLVASRHGHPIQHTAYVLYHVVQIGLGEGLGSDRMKVLVAASIYHDAGFEGISPDEKQIKMSHIRAEPDPDKREELRRKAIEQRQRHAHDAVQLVETELDPQKMFGKPNYLNYSKLIYIIERHDYPTVAELVEDEKSRWLFTESDRDYLAAIHREADRLWMLTVDGVIADLVSDRATGRFTELAHAKLVYNRRRHLEEGELYRTYLPKLVGLGLISDAGFYRTGMGRRLFEILPHQTIAALEAVDHYHW